MPILSSNLFSKRGNLIHNRPIMDKVCVFDFNNLGKKRDITLPDIDKDGSIVVKGLLDTGATTTCISRSLADRHDFQPVRQAFVTSASHKAVPTNVYRVAVYIGYDRIAKTTKGGVETLTTKTGMLSPPQEIYALEFAGDDSFDVIVGMDIIARGLLLVSGNEDRVTITF